ncbi:unnamed protein product [Schistosoma margrebowiei]|uniref:Uncharacterized protein n=1 Tax=Schistosoma margrebowiei TaxID=48269 RepID=A0A183M0C6_9TREM|nr:unnamed protein product [Schistosoma margrebowiei]
MDLYRNTEKIKERRSKIAAINNSRTRGENVKAQTEYIEANKRLKKSIRFNKEKYVEERATMVEKGASKGNTKQLCEISWKPARKYSKPGSKVKGLEGRPITEIQKH